jgi:hypothetical protein
MATRIRFLKCEQIIGREEEIYPCCINYSSYVLIVNYKMWKDYGFGNMTRNDEENGINCSEAKHRKGKNYLLGVDG